MNLQAEKLEVVRMILDTDDKDIIMEVKTLFKKRTKTDGLEDFYEGFRGGVREIKSSLDGKTELKDAKAWLDDLQD